jgi:glycogen synthase
MIYRREMSSPIDVATFLWILIPYDVCPGKPKVVLLNPTVVTEKQLNEIKYLIWENYGIDVKSPPLIDQVVAFAYLVKLFIDEVVLTAADGKVLAHFHEWMAGLPMLDLKREKSKVKTIFTTHATQSGRHLTINSPQFYEHLPFFNRQAEAKKFKRLWRLSVEEFS